MEKDFGMFNFFGKNQPPAPQTPWLKWLVLAFLAFAVISGIPKGTPESPNQVREAFQQAKTELAPKNLINFGDYKSIFKPEFAGELRLRDIAEGNGPVAVCGQRATITYETYLTDGNKLPDEVTKDEPLAFRLGAGKAMPVFEQGIIGMREGGRRSLFAPASMAYGTEGFKREGMPDNAPVRFEVELLSLSPALPDIENSPYRIMVTRTSGGKPIRCGVPARIHVTLWTIDGKKLFAGDKPITFTPGNSELPLGIEQGAIGLEQGGMRTIILPPAFQKTMDGNAPSVMFPFPEGQTVLVDIEALP